MCMAARQRLQADTDFLSDPTHGGVRRKEKVERMNSGRQKAGS